METKKEERERNEILRSIFDNCKDIERMTLDLIALSKSYHEQDMKLFRK